ncbi:GNAT family N-acetyltransferase [Zhouia amylolytica]|uniref:N-acetyltransferase GCN5 n=1 Tax=Zhouia amylolytica AD3 TaxID=1286632 RepID=W2UUE9_9FLAO|nr:GNAT family N-acetyltransferase [Zhouia amylolytica]ETN96982.1 N-acetyltransferase GCN5 [Zhouia amylolytica AD3]MCQ0110173.1 N-acetyltransferase [Zhouia amylolytica]
MNFHTITTYNYPKVAQIYQAGIDSENATFEVNVPTYQEWDQKHLPFGRIALFDKNKMVGWASLSRVSQREVYNGVAEVSIYIAPNQQRKGIGTLLLQKLIEESESNGIWTLQCGIMRENKASIGLHKKCGFREIGYREKIAELHGVWRDNILMERRSKKIGRSS